MSDPVKVIAKRLQRQCEVLATASLGDSSSTNWRSLLYDGARHRIALRIDGNRVDDALAAIRRTVETSDFAICGHLIVDILIADIAREADHALVTVSALTIKA